MYPVPTPSHPRPTPTIPVTHNVPCKSLAASRFVQRTSFSYNYVTVDLIKIIFLIFIMGTFPVVKHYSY